MKAALDLGAVNEAVNVTGVYSLSVFSTSAFTHYKRKHNIVVHYSEILQSQYLVATFRAESIAELTLPLALSLHLHFLWRTDADTRAAVYHKMS